MRFCFVCFCGGKRRDRKRMASMINSWATERADILTAKVQKLNQKVQELDQEADDLYDKVEEHVKEKKSRDWHIFVMKEDIETRKRWPQGKPPGYKSPEELREQREKETEKQRKDAEFKTKCKQARDNEPLQLYMKDLKANLAKDPDFYNRTPAPAYMQRKFLGKGETMRLDAARAVWPIRFGKELPEVMTAAECDKAMRIGSEILYPGLRPMGFTASMRIAAQ